MFHHSGSRNHRSKGSNVKRILQMAVLLAVACWLIYQVKQSHQKKVEFARNNEIKISKTGEEIYLGRKGDAGSENVVIIDANTQVSDDSTEAKQDEVRHDIQVSDDSTEAKQDEVHHDTQVSDDSTEAKQDEVRHDTHVSDDSTEAKQDEVRHDTAILNNEDIPTDTPHSDDLLDSQESKPEQHDHSHANDGEEHEDSKDSEKTENTKTYSGAGEGVEATVVGEETTSSSADDQSGKITGKENGEASGESGVQEVSTDVDASKGKGVDSDEHNNSSSEISIDSNIDGHAGDGAITNDANAFHGDAIHEAEAAGVENVDANFEASKGGEVGAQVEGVSEVENSDNNSSGERKTESENSSSDAEGKRIHGEENSSEASSNVDGNSQNNNSQESKKETEKSEEGAAGDAVESQGNEGRKSEEKSNDVSEKEGGSVNDGAAALTEVNEKISSGDSSTEIPTGEAARSETESTNGGNMEESNKSEQSSNMETGEEGSAVQ